MRTPKSRARKITITPEVIELYRKGQRAWNVWNGTLGDESLSETERDAALAAVQAFDRAVGHKPWCHSLLSPHSDGNTLRASLLAAIPEDERKEFTDYARRWWKKTDMGHA